MMEVALEAVMDIASPYSRLTTPSLPINWPQSSGDVESLRFPEHTHIPAGHASRGRAEAICPKTPDPFVALTAAPSATRELRLGTQVCLVVERDPA
jgi:hypothetical protein